MCKSFQFASDRRRLFCSKFLILALLTLSIFAIPLYATANPLGGTTSSIPGVHTGGSEILTKILRIPEGTTVPVDARFHLSFEATQAVLSETPLVTTRPVADVPAITGEQYISLNPVIDDPVNGVVTVRGTFDLWSVLDGLAYPGGGVYLWKVSEVDNSSNTVEPGFMTYDKTSYQIRAYVERDGSLGSIEVYRILENDTLSEKLAEGIVFENSYRRNVGTSIENNAFEIRKEVTGNFANLSTPFSFELNLIEHPLASLPSTITASIVGSDGQEIRSLTIAGSSLSFELQDGEALVIPTLPAGTRFSIRELAHPEFKPSAEVFSGGVRAGYEGEAGAALQTGEYLIRDNGRNAADFTNMHQFSPATGLFSNNSAVFAVLGAFVGIVALLVLRRRKAIEEISILG